jgi:hypothetical protein
LRRGTKAAATITRKDPKASPQAALLLLDQQLRTFFVWCADADFTTTCCILYAVWKIVWQIVALFCFEKENLALLFESCRYVTSKTIDETGVWSCLVWSGPVIARWFERAGLAMGIAMEPSRELSLTTEKGWSRRRSQGSSPLQSPRPQSQKTSIAETIDGN